MNENKHSFLEFRVYSCINTEVRNIQQTILFKANLKIVLQSLYVQMRCV